MIWSFNKETHAFNLTVGMIRNEKELHIVIVFVFLISLAQRDAKICCNFSPLSSFTSADVSSLCTVLYNAEHYSKN